VPIPRAVTCVQDTDEQVQLLIAVAEIFPVANQRRTAPESSCNAVPVALSETAISLSEESRVKTLPARFMRIASGDQDLPRRGQT